MRLLMIDAPPLTTLYRPHLDAAVVAARDDGVVVDKLKASDRRIVLVVAGERVHAAAVLNVPNLKTHLFNDESM